jgi:hypothetical protein
MTKKTFDCVRMKREIQAQLAREYAGIPEDVAREQELRAAEADPILGPLLRRIRAAPPTLRGKRR